MNYTKGPWRTAGVLRLPSSIAVKSDSKPLICEVILYVDGDKESEANANLISAAPEMYEAVEAMLEEYEAGANIQPYVIREMCRAALAKAEGRV